LNSKLPIPIYFFLFLILSSNIYAQSTYQFGVLPSINLNKNLTKGWGLNFKWESRQSIAVGEFGAQPEAGFDYILSDFALFITKKVGLNNSIAGGYQLRARDHEIIHRTALQFAILKKYDAFRLSHRFSTDQTFAQQSPTELRLRYRLATEFPLNGTSVDPHEFYFKLNNEYLNSFEGESYDLELRLVPMLGYGFTENNKLELGLDYRINSFLDDPPRQIAWLSINWYFKMP
jgi:Protein of unknown function (DUF2490)